MAGGTWTSQNKIRPGVYIRFKSSAASGLTVGERGVVTICEPLSWGPVAQVMEVSADADMRQYTGYDITSAKNRFLAEIFRGSNRTAAPRTVLLYRPTASGSAQASASVGTMTATAKYPGARGNDLSIVMTALTDPADAFEVSTVLDGEIVDQQTGKTVADLTSNDWVSFTGTGALSANTGTALAGGMDGTVQAAAYAAYLSAIEPYKFDVIIYDGAETTVQTAMVSFVKRIADEAGVYAQLVASGLSNPDSRFVINVGNGVTLSDGTALTAAQCTWWVGGAAAGAGYNEDLTYASYPGAVNVSARMTNKQYEDAIKAGNFVFFAEDGQVRVEYDINTLTTYTTDIGQVFHYNRTMRLCNTIANDIYKQFSAGFVGSVNNNDAGRNLFKAAIVGYLLDIQANNGIQNFSADDVEVLPGEAIDAIVVNIAVQAVGSVNKIYITLDIA